MLCCMRACVRGEINDLEVLPHIWGGGGGREYVQGRVWGAASPINKAAALSALCLLFLVPAKLEYDHNLRLQRFIAVMVVNYFPYNNIIAAIINMLWKSMEPVVSYEQACRHELV